MSDRSSNCLGRREESGHEQDFEGFVELSCRRHLTFKLFKDTIRKIYSTNGIIQLSKPRTDMFFSLRFFAIRRRVEMSEGNLRRAVQNLKKKAVVSQNAFFFKIIIVFFLSYFFLAKLVSFFQSSTSVKRSAILQRQKKFSAAGMITTADQRRPTRSLNYICKSR